MAVVVAAACAGPLDLVCQLAGSVQGAASDYVLGGLGSAFVAGAAQVGQLALAALDSTAAIDLGAAWFRGNVAVIASIALPAVVGLFVIQQCCGRGSPRCRSGAWRGGCNRPSADDTACAGASTRRGRASVSDPQVRATTFARLERRGVLLGLSGAQLAVVGIAAGVAVAAVYSAGSTGLLVSAPVWGVLLAVGAVSVAGRPVVGWLPLLAAWRTRRLLGVTTKAASTRESAPHPSARPARPRRSPGPDRQRRPWRGPDRRPARRDRDRRRARDRTGVRPRRCSDPGASGRRLGSGAGERLQAAGDRARAAQPHGALGPTIRPAALRVGRP